TACRTARDAGGAVHDRGQRLPRRRQGEPVGREHHAPRGPGPDRGAGERRRGGLPALSSLLDVQTFGSVFVTLLVIMDPPGALPIFIALTAPLTHRQKVAAA